MFALRRARLAVLPAAAVASIAYSALRRRALCEATDDAQPGYRMPPADIAALADAKPIPSVSVQPKNKRKVLYMHHDPMLTLEDVSAPVLKLGGARFNPCTLVPHGTHGPELYHSALEVQDICTHARQPVRGLPAGARIAHLSWSPDGSMLAFSVRTAEVGDDAVARLWLLDVDSAEAAPVQPEQRLNGVLGSPIRWLPGSRALLVKRPIGTRADEPSPSVVPSSPSVQHAAGGAKAAVRTYPHLLTSEADAAAFRHYTTVQLVQLDLSPIAAATASAPASDSASTSASVTAPPATSSASPAVRLGRVDAERPIGVPAMVYGYRPSPDGLHLLTSSIRPEQLSYAVPWSRYGRRIEMLPLTPHGASRVLQETPPLEAMPIGHDAVRPGPRNYSWRPDQPATLTYLSALDGGDPKAKASHRDTLYVLPAPFESPPAEWLRTQSRIVDAEWGADGAALVWSRQYHTRTTTITYVSPAGVPRPYMSYDFSDAYGHPGSPLLEEGRYGPPVLRRHGAHGAQLLWQGGGASPEGARPFVDVRNYVDGQRVRRLWRAAVGCYDTPVALLPSHSAYAVAPAAVASGDAEFVLLSRRQTQTQPPQLLVRAITVASSASASDGAPADDSCVLATLSDPPHPQPLLRGVSKTLIRYERDDGVPLSGTLYTPAGYDAARDGPLPTILWAYPREFKSKGSAGQVRGGEEHARPRTSTATGQTA